MAVEEGTIYINSQWNTRQVKEASFDLVYSSREVLEILVHSLQQFDPDLRQREGTLAVGVAFNLRNVPTDRKIQWDRSERWVLKFFSDLSFRHTPASLDNKIFSGRELVEGFDSVQDALTYWGEKLESMDQRLARLEEGSTATLKVVDSSYVDSRVLRLATQGTYLVHPGAFTFVEN